MSKSFINIVYSWDIWQFNFKKNHWAWACKILNCLTGLTGHGIIL